MTEIIGVILLLITSAAPMVCCCMLVGREILRKDRSFGRNVGALLLWSAFTALCMPLCLLVLCIRRWGWIGGTLRAAGGVVLCVMLWAGSLLLALPSGEITETDSLADYRVVTGNYNNERPQAFIDSFFPAEIGDDFSDPVWHYKAIRFDTIACEACLEFTLPDEAAFAAHYAGLAQHGEPQPFPFDGRYEAWVIDNRLDTWTGAERGRPDPEAPDIRRMEAASVGLILCDRETQHFIYFALVVHDGGATNETDLNFFLNRFGVTLQQFEKAICE